MLKKIGVAVGAAGLIAIGLSGSAQAFPTKDITFVIPYKTGGGFDAYVRKMSPLFEKFLPKTKSGKSVRVIPKNVPAAGGRKALSDVYRAKPDGHTWILTNMPGMALDRILGKKSNFDIEKFVWLGRVAVSPYVLAVATKPKNGKTPYKSWKELKGKKLKYPVTSFASGAFVNGAIMADRMGLDVKFLTGYKGSSAAQLELIKGNMDLSLFAYRSYTKYAKTGALKAILSFEKKAPEKGIPTVGDIGYPDLTILAVERILATTPGVPAKTAKIIEDALMKVLATKEMKTWKRPTNPKSAAWSKKRVADMITTFSKYRKVLAKR